MEFGASSWKSAILLLLILTNCTLANASSLAITATIDSLNDTNQSNNSKNINIDVVETEPLNIVYVPMGYNNLDKYKADINKNSELLLATYPLEKNNLREVITENIFDAGATLGTLAITELLKTMIPAFLLADQSFDRIVGVFPQGGLEQGQGFAFVHTELPVLIEPRTWGDKIYQNSMAHEIGHTFGFCEEYSLSDWDRQNTAIPFINCANDFPQYCIDEHREENCLGERVYNGFWVEKKQVKTYDPPITENYCFMGTAKTGDENARGNWIERDDYLHLLTKFISWGPLFSETTTLLESQNILINGTMDKEGTIEFDSFYIASSEAPPLIPGNYSIELQDINGAVLSDANFAFPVMAGVDEDLNKSFFNLTVPYSADAYKIVGKFNGITRAERLVSANAPTVSIISPSGGEEWSETHLVEWSASDIDGDSLNFVLQYSSDDGATWNPLAIDLNEESYELNAGYLTPAESYKLKVIATDGVLTGEAVSNAFTVRNPDIDLQPWKLDFGEAEQGTNVIQNFELINTGNENLEVSGYGGPANASISGLSLPITLLPSQSTQFQVRLNTAGLEGPIDETIVFYSNDPNEPEKHLFIEGHVFIPETFDGNLHLSDMNSYQKEQGHYSGAATAKMILDYIREAAGYPTISQDKIYTYGHVRNSPGNNEMPELDAKAMDAVLGHFDPYDHIITAPYNGYDSLADGNPYQGYNYTVDAYEDAAGYMQDIAHWMAYPVTRKAWWQDNDLVAEPYTPAAIPIYGSYNSWVAVNGFAASGNPVPFPKTDPWHIADITIYGFWLTDPAIDGIGQHVYVTAGDANATYFRPMNTNDSYNGKYLQVAEPPVRPPETGYETKAMAMNENPKAKIAEQKADLASLEFIGIRIKERGKNSAASLYWAKSSWKDLVDNHMLFDAEAVAAFEDANMASPMLVDSLAGADYYLVPFEKDGLTSGVIMLDAQDGHFEQATWTSVPQEYLPIDERNAINLAKKAAMEDQGPKNVKAGQADTKLQWEAGPYSQSPFMPYWVVTMSKQGWIVSQEGNVIKAS